MRRRLFALAFLLSACRGADAPPTGNPSPPEVVAASPSITTSAAGPTATASAAIPAAPVDPPPAAWWSVTSRQASDPVAAVRTSADEIVIVSPDNQVSLRPAHLEQGNGSEWTWTAGKSTCVLAKVTGGDGATLTCTTGAFREFLALKPSASAARYDALVARSRPPKDACPRAEACFAAAYAITSPGTQPNLDSEIGNPRDPQKCQKTFASMKMLFGEMKKPLPKECR